MEFKRSSHVAVHVAPERIEEAVAHYVGLLGVSEKSRSDEGIELVGPNFTIWIDKADGGPAVLQEFTVYDGPGARAAVEASGAKVIGETEYGFFVADPFGMAYHVYVESKEPD